MGYAYAFKVLTCGYGNKNEVVSIQCSARFSDTPKQFLVSGTCGHTETSAPPRLDLVICNYGTLADVVTTIVPWA